MKKHRSIGRRVITINMFFAFVTLGVFLFSFLFFSNMTASQNRQYADDVLEAVSISLSRETHRLSALTGQVGRDRSVVLASSNKLGVQRFINDSQTVSDKLTLVQGSLPYAQNVYAYVKQNQRVISLNNAVMSRKAFDTAIQRDLLPGEALPDLDTVQNGFYVYHSFVLYVNNVLDCGSILIKMNPEEFCDFDLLTATNPNYILLVLNQNGQVFASNDKSMNGVIEQISLSQPGPWRIQYEGTPLEITRKESPASGFQLLLIHRTNEVGQQQYALNMLVLLAGVVVFTTCVLTVLLNKRIYMPLRSICRLYSGPTSEDEFEVIRNRIDELIRENTEITIQMEVQRDLQTDIALNYALHTSGELPKAAQELIQSQYGRYWIAVAAAQNQTGSCGDFFTRLDSHLTDLLECRVIRVEAFCHAYMIPARKSTREGREVLLGAMEEYAEEGGMMFVAGASDFFDSVADLPKAFRQARERMLSTPIPLGNECLLSMADSSDGQSSAGTISLEVQNTVAGYILNGSAAEIENILQSVLYSKQDETLREFISLYHGLCSLIDIVLSSSGVSIPQEELRTQQSQQNCYSPSYMFDCVFYDCKLVNEKCNNGQGLLRYRITEYLCRHYTEALSLESIAAVFGITPVYLSAYFKKNVGVNLSVYLSNVRMEKAKTLLGENPSIKLAELSAMVGIPTVPTFSRQFKHYTGVTPDQYRKANRSS